MTKITTQRFYAWAGVAGMSLLALSPAIASAATSTANTTINAAIASTISITSSGTVNVALTPTAGGVVSSASDTVSVSTNNVTGYNLTLANGDTNTSLASGGNTIAAHAGTYAVPTALTGNGWGYAVAGGNFTASYTAESNSGTSTTKWAGVPSSASPQALKSTGTTASADTTTVWYGVRATTSQAAGTYTDTVTYTATTN